MGIGTEIATLIDNIIRDVTVPFDLGQKQFKESWVDKEFKICLCTI